MFVHAVVRILWFLFLSCGIRGKTPRDVCDSGRAQSPVNIQTKDTVLCGSDFKSLLLDYSYGLYDAAQITNNGNTVAVTLSDLASGSYILKGGPLKAEYSFSQMHFHWGKHDKEGSEHTLNKNRFSMELHVLHYKTEYGSSEAAMEYDDGLAVVSFFLLAQGSDNKDLKPMIEAVRSLTKRNETLTLRMEDALEWVLKAASEGPAYFSYNGSLTTPPCTENVSWFMFTEPIKMSSQQVEVFRNLQANGRYITQNFRKTYPLNGRILTHCLAWI